MRVHTQSHAPAPGPEICASRGLSWKVNGVLPFCRAQAGTFCKTLSKKEVRALCFWKHLVAN